MVLEKEEYIKKAEELLKEKTYKIIPTDPTNRQKNKLIQILKKIKEEGGISEATYKKVYPTGAGIPKFYGLPKIHKAGVPLRPIVSSRGSVAYNIAKELARILKSLAGRTATFYYTTSTHLLCNQPEEVLFNCFMTMLNDASERELALADEGYESGSETSNLPTPLRRTFRIHHVSSDENISFDPSTPHTTATSQ